MSARVTGIIHTKNEERNLAQAIRSLRQIADEIVVADMESTDGTVEIAESLGARVLKVPDFGYLEPALRLSYGAASYDWILRIDADEILPLQLVQTLRDAVESERWDGVLIPRLNFFFGQPLLHSGWGPASDRHLRLFRKSAVGVPSERVHSGEIVNPDARILKLDARPQSSIWHFNYLDWSHFLEKLDRYTSIEARSLLERDEALRITRLVLQCCKEIARRYFYRKGYRDGYRGAVLTLLMVVYRVMTYAKARQLKEVGDRDRVEKLYADIASNKVEALAGLRVATHEEEVV